MKGGGLGRPPPDAGIPYDMKALFKAFQARKSLRLVEFYEVAVNHGLKDIYAGRMSVADLVGFKECLLSAAFAYTRPRREYPNGLGEEHTLAERIFGVYVTFVVYYAQPIDYISKVHATPQDCDNLICFLQDTLIPGRHMDACACLQRLFIDDAFRTVTSVKNHDLSNHRRYERPNPIEVLLDEQERHIPLEVAAEVMEHPILKAMSYVQRKMDEKGAMLQNERFVDKSRITFLHRLHNIYATLVHEIRKTDNGSEEDIFEKGKGMKRTVLCEKSGSPKTRVAPDADTMAVDSYGGKKEYGRNSH